jgi:fused signal recognition particle receptor
MGKLSNFFSKQDQDKLDHGLSNTKKSFFSRLGTAVIGKTKIDEDVLDELETILIQSDVGVATTLKIIAALEARIAKDKYLKTEDLIQRMQEEILALLVNSENNTQSSFEDNLKSQPHVVMVVGVNGVGKTTSVGKLAHQYKKAGKKVMLGAADTFRAGAIDQLQIWADRVEVPLVRQEMGSDPASVAFDTLESAKAQGCDIVFIDTAGRLHNKVNLMNELTKVKRVMSKIITDAPHEVLLVLDGSTGQNAFEQAKQFTAATDVTSLAITKLDGTAKGGVLLGISDQFQIPVKYIGVGEGIDDIQVFNPKAYIKTLFS